MIWGALRLHEATAEQRYFDQAVAWVEILDRHYWVEGEGGYATSADDTRDVIVRLRPGTDDATPNANAIMLANLAGARNSERRGSLRRTCDRIARGICARRGGATLSHTLGSSRAHSTSWPRSKSLLRGQHLVGGGKS
ncbi:MAG: hypothetical protein WDN31_00355 [Hyphomicrobium sp.]